MEEKKTSHAGGCPQPQRKQGSQGSQGSQRPRRKADRDLQAQLSAVADALKANEDALLDCLPPGNWEDIGQVPSAKTDIELFDETKLEARIAESLRTSEAVLKAELARARSLGPKRQVARPPALRSLQQLETDFPHFASVLALVAQRRTVASLVPGRAFRLPPILLAGDPGVGKTAFAEALAESIAQPLRRVDIAASTAGFALGGSHESWHSARHGAVWSLLQGYSASGVLLLDEVDKAGNSNFPVLGPLYSLLEPVSASRFTDEYIQVPVNAAYLTVVATCNDVGGIEPALLSRFRVFHIPTPTPAQIPAIASSVYAQVHAAEEWDGLLPKVLTADVLSVLGTHTPRELSQLLREAGYRALANGRRRLLPQDILAQQAALTAARQGKPDAASRRSIGFL